jgi:hypothetical protein
MNLILSCRTLSKPVRFDMIVSNEWPGHQVRLLPEKPIGTIREEHIFHEKFFPDEFSSSLHTLCGFHLRIGAIVLLGTFCLDSDMPPIEGMTIVHTIAENPE